MVAIGSHRGFHRRQVIVSRLTVRHCPQRLMKVHSFSDGLSPRADLHLLQRFSTAYAVFRANVAPRLNLTPTPFDGISRRTVNFASFPSA